MKGMRSIMIVAFVGTSALLYAGSGCGGCDDASYRADRSMHCPHTMKKKGAYYADRGSCRHKSREYRGKSCHADRFYRGDRSRGDYHGRCHCGDRNYGYHEKRYGAERCGRRSYGDGDYGSHRRCGGGQYAAKKTGCGGNGYARMAGGQGGYAAGKNGRYAKEKKSHLKRMLRTLYRRLDLSPDQKEKVRSIVREYRRELKMLRRTAMQERKSRRMQQGPKAGVTAFMSPEAFDKAAFKKMVEARWAQQDQRRMKRLDLTADTLEKIYGVLTPEQRTRLIEISRQRAAQRAGRGQPVQ